MTRTFGIICESMPLITVVILLALLAVPKRMSATTRHQVLVIAALLCLAAPFLQQVMPNWRVLPRPNAAWTTHATVMTPGLVDRTRDDVPVALPLPMTRAIATADWRPWFRICAVVWLAGTALALLRLAFNQAALRRCIRRSVAASTGIQQLAATLLGRPLRVRLAEDIADAFVCQVFSPVVMLPASAAHLPHDQLRLILAHELAHIRRRDPLWTWLLEGFRAIYWLHPLVWVLVKRCHLAREMATDDLVLLDGSDPELYAACLGSTALRHREHAAPPLPALAFVRQHPVLVRLHAILDATRTRTVPSGKGWLSAGLPLAAPALLLASLGFKAAAEVQPVRQARLKLGPTVESTPSLWSDVIEPVVAAVRPESQDEATPSVAEAPPPGSTPGGDQAEPPAPLVAAVATARVVRLEPEPAAVAEFVDDDEAELLTSPAISAVPAGDFAPPLGRARNGRTAPIADIPSPPASKPEQKPQAKPKPKPAASGTVQPPDTPDPALAATTEPTTTSTSPHVTTSSTARLTNEVLVDPMKSASNGIVVPWVFPSGQFRATAIGSAIPPAPRLEVVPYATAAGSHLAVAWNVPEAETAQWHPEASPDLVTWSTAPDAMILHGPMPVGEGTVRFIAAVREPMPGSHYKFLRLVTPSTSGVSQLESPKE